MRQGSFKHLLLSMLLGQYLDGMTRTEARGRVKTQMRHNRAKKAYKPVKGMLELGQEVWATTKNAKRHKCVYWHRRFHPLGKPYSFSHHEITDWGKQ